MFLAKKRSEEITLFVKSQPFQTNAAAATLQVNYNQQIKNILSNNADSNNRKREYLTKLQKKLEPDVNRAIQIKISNAIQNLTKQIERQNLTDKLTQRFEEYKGQINKIKVNKDNITNNITKLKNLKNAIQKNNNLQHKPQLYTLINKSLKTLVTNKVTKLKTNTTNRTNTIKQLQNLKSKLNNGNVFSQNTKSELNSMIQTSMNNLGANKSPGPTQPAAAPTQPAVPTQPTKNAKNASRS